MAERKEIKRIRIVNIRQSADEDGRLQDLAAGAIGAPPECLSELVVLRRGVDRRQRRVDYVYTLAVTVEMEKGELARLLARGDVEVFRESLAQVAMPLKMGLQRPVIVGCGPAGLFAARTLLARGSAPIVIERGERIAQRSKTVKRFWREGAMNCESNVLFGEGGAGTFSDGKLTTRIKSPLKQAVLQTLVDAGADPEILYLSKPHIGTDRLRKIIPNIVDSLSEKGVEFLFNTRVDEIHIQDRTVTGLVAAGRFISARAVFLAAGHSSRDLYRHLHSRGVEMVPKGFAVGLRIEHPQELIDGSLLGRQSGVEAKGPADYFLSFKDPESGRGVYSFCMCPGGVVIGCASAHGALCTNGMSRYSRKSGRANAAVVVTVRPDDFSAAGPLAGIRMQEQIERSAFEMGGGTYYAPAQRANDYVGTAERPIGSEMSGCTYRPGIVPADMRGLLPADITRPLQRALKNFDTKISGFLSEGLMIGVETRTSAPLRIVRRADTGQALGIRGLIPVGEGSGYAGGIVSSAVDGMKAALNFEG